MVLVLIYKRHNNSTLRQRYILREIDFDPIGHMLLPLTIVQCLSVSWSQSASPCARPGPAAPPSSPGTWARRPARTRTSPRTRRTRRHQGGHCSGPANIVMLIYILHGISTLNITYLNSSCQCCRKIEEGPKSTEPELNHEPGNDVEFFHGVNEVHYQKHEAHPEGGHRDKHKPLSYCLLLVVRTRAHHADETQNIHQLKWGWAHCVSCIK